MKTWLKAILGAGAVLTLGTAVFVFSRPAAAAAHGRKGFRVNPECTLVEIIDEDEAKEALIDAAMSDFPGMDAPAAPFIVKAIGIAIPTCPINDYMKITGIPGVPFGVTIGQIKAIIGDRTIGEVSELAAQGGLPGVPGLDGAMGDTVSENGPGPQNPINAILAWTTGGDYP